MTKTNLQTLKLVGRVTYGNALGQRLGFPTANLIPSSSIEGIADGVWAGVALIEGRDYRAVVNIGYSPSVVECGERRVEAHIIDFSGDLYNKEIHLALYHHLRSEIKFDSREELVEQIRRDKQKAIELLTDNDIETNN